MLPAFFFKCFSSNPLHSGDTFFFGPWEDPCLAAEESRQAFLRSPASVRVRSMVGYSFPALLPFSSKFCQRRGASALQVGRWLYRTPQAHIKEDHILKLSVCLCARDSVLEPTIFKVRKRSFQNAGSMTKTPQKQWGSSTSREEKHEQLITLQNIPLEVFSFALIYCGDIL